jgi:hypothetical protein
MAAQLYAAPLGGAVAHLLEGAGDVTICGNRAEGWRRFMARPKATRSTELVFQSAVQAPGGRMLSVCGTCRRILEQRAAAAQPTDEST